MSERLTELRLEAFANTEPNDSDAAELVAEVRRLRGVILAEYEAWNDEEGKPETWLTDEFVTEARAISKESGA